MGAKDENKTSGQPPDERMLSPNLNPFLNNNGNIEHHIYQNHVYQLDLENNNNSYNLLNNNNNNIYVNPLDFLDNHTILCETISNQQNNNDTNTVICSNYFLSTINTGTPKTEATSALKNKCEKKKSRREKGLLDKDIKKNKKSKAKPIHARARSGAGAGGSNRRGADDPLASRARRNTNGKKEKQIRIE